jgi:hypothetical protein
VIDYHNARWKPETDCDNVYYPWNTTDTNLFEF